MYNVMKEDNTNLIIRNDEVQEILSAPPHMLLSIGSSVIGCILTVLLIGCFVFKYPDIISCTITVTGNNPPVWIVAHASGRIQELYVMDKRKVEIGDMIAVIENPAETHDVLLLDSMVSDLKYNEGTAVDIGIDNPRLGDIQSAYSVLCECVANYNNFMGNNLYDSRIAAEKARLIPYMDYMTAIRKQLKYSQRISELAATNYHREKNLYEKGVTSSSDMESAEELQLGRNVTVEQMYSSLANAKIQMAEINNTISELILQREQEKNQIETALRSAVETVHNSIQEWKQNYLLKSPVAGVLSYNNLWKVNQNISADEKAFSVISHNSGGVVGRAKIPVAGSGKVKAGQRVNIQLDGYPYLEYGFLTGTVLSVSATPDNDFYTATINIGNDGMTSYGKHINIYGDLTGIAEIVTDDLSLAERIISPFRYLFEKYIS